MDCEQHGQMRRCLRAELPVRGGHGGATSAGGRNGAVADPAPPVALLAAHLISLFMRAFTHSTLNLGTRAQYLESANGIPILDLAGIRGGSEAFGRSAACVMIQVGVAGDPRV
jgi:hypothetical protein